MSEFPDCDECIMVGGANDGVVFPIARGVNMVQFHIAGGGLITYRRAIPAQFRDGHIVFKLSE